MHFREEPVTPVYRHWMCEQVGCNGEVLSTGEGITRLSTRWKHRCGKCGHEDWADATYPRVAYLPVDAIGPDDSYNLKLVRKFWPAGAVFDNRAGGCAAEPGFPIFRCRRDGQIQGKISSRSAGCRAFGPRRSGLAWGRLAA
jgi:hypothetical protein